MKTDVPVPIIRYERATGRILDTGTTCLPETLEDRVAAVLVGQQAPSVDMHRVDLETLRVMPLPPRPDQWHEFDYRQLRWVDPRSEAELWSQVRAQRDQLLAATDWTQLPDVPESTRSTWMAYRQALRDVTQQQDPRDITWPPKPGVI